MINISEKNNCTGCAACQQVCDHQAIAMKYDDDGHLYPLVDLDRCINCGLCDKVCPMLHKERVPKDEHLNTLPAYAVYNKNSYVRERSTSGGIFTLLSDTIIKDGGVVYAVRFDENFKIVHSSFTNLDDIDPFRGSKYAQSWLGDTFRDIRKEVRSGRKVLFIGTPCQVAGLRCFLMKEYSNLYTCDFICMGISSSKMWEEYLHDYWRGEKIERIFFKDKRIGWHQWKMLIEYGNGKEYLVGGMKDPFFNLYLTHLSFRPSCFSCPFRTCKRLSDFTIADCWGIDKVTPDFDDNKGCTTLILQSKKACDVFETIRAHTECIPYSIDKIKKYNPYISHPVNRNNMCDDFYERYRKNGFKSAANKYAKAAKNSLIRRIINKIGRVIK